MYVRAWLPLFPCLYAYIRMCFLITWLQGGDSAPAPKVTAAASKVAVQQAPKSAAMRTFHVILPLLILAVALILNFYSGSRK